MSKYKININREPLSPKDIETNMDFNTFHSAYAAKAGWLGKGTKLYLSVSIAVLVVAGISYWLYRSGQKDIPAEQAFINPPLPQLYLHPDKMILDADGDTTIIYKTGTSIHIPSNVFKTKDGKDVKGKIEIRYREFHDQVDLILSGIPMDYDSAGTQYQFESAGMFEILAFQDNEPLLLKPGKELEVNMPSTTYRNDFNVYYLDTIQKKWLYRDNNTKNCKENIYAAVMKNEEFAHWEELETRAMVAPKKANSGTYSFYIDYDKDEFPELAVFDSVKFEVDEKEKNYYPELSVVTWEEVSIRKSSDNEHYKLTFNKGKRSVSFMASPVFDEQNYDKAMKEYEYRKRQHAKLSRAKMDSIAKIKVVNINGSPENSNANNRFNNFISKTVVYRSIAIDELGIWNHDMEFSFFGGKTHTMLNAHFNLDNSNEQLKLRNIFLVNRRINAIYPVLGNKFDSFVSFPFSSNVDIIVGITFNNEVVYLKDEELRQLTVSGKDISFKMHKAPAFNNDPEQLKLILEI